MIDEPLDQSNIATLHRKMQQGFPHVLNTQSTAPTTQLLSPSSINTLFPDSLFNCDSVPPTSSCKCCTANLLAPLKYFLGFALVCTQC